MKRIIEKLSLLTLKDIILSVVISLILVSIGTTFAYFSWQSTNNPLVNITVEDMADVKFSGGNDLKATDIGPVLDYNDGEIIDFSVRKKIDAPIYALIQVTPKILPNEFKVSYFKGNYTKYKIFVKIQPRFYLKNMRGKSLWRKECDAESFDEIE